MSTPTTTPDPELVKHQLDQAAKTYAAAKCHPAPASDPNGPHAMKAFNPLALLPADLVPAVEAAFLAGAKAAADSLATHYGFPAPF
jgi:hypothetical protein